jgi:hypothetical protein
MKSTGRKIALAGFVVVAVMVMTCVVYAEGWMAPVSGSFTNNYGAWTNTTGQKIALSSVLISSDTFGASATSTISVLKWGREYMLSSGLATNTLTFLDGTGGIMLDTQNVVRIRSSGNPTNLIYFAIDLLIK